MRTVAEEAGQSTPSLFWERLLARRRGSADLPAGSAELGPGELLPLLGPEVNAAIADRAHPREDPRYRRSLELMRGARKASKGLSPEALGADVGEWEQMRALLFLSREGLLEEYEGFLAARGLRSGMEMARHFHYTHVIEALVRGRLHKASLDVLEIGAGPGWLAYFLHQRGLVRSYCIVDLPESLLQCGYVIQRWLPQAELTFNEVRRDPVGIGFSLLTPRFLPQMPDDSFDACLNVNSFMEMDERDRDGYIAEIYRTGRRGALFFNVNRRQRALPQRDGSTFDNNPLLYPYQDDDVVLWEEDQFQQVTRSGFQSAPSLAIVRAAILR
jgi:SAM-dependent methyltransferase